ncbi:hypothetical protein CICLE_v10033313mg [Citrus x clementina]|uniref:DUF4371 domain-containing protein n=1 Tax=Citrus clementina TaxID=85681 RepID=V4TGB4_CITCL|nr:hypothetical protein CICLE_v10033313mg [Citrus x clementina]
MKFVEHIYKWVLANLNSTNFYIIRACSIEVTNAIIRDVSDALFYVLIDESHKNKSVIERFIGLKHVTSTTTISLKEAFDQLFSKHGLSIFRLRGQGYNEAGNMQGKFNGLRTLIMNENECAYYIHCFAHQLQLAIMAVANKHDQVNYFFNVGANVVNVVGASYLNFYQRKRRDILREKQLLSVVEALENDDLPSEQDQNQETTLKCFGDTRWGSHYGTLLCIISLFPHIISVLEIMAKDKSNSSDQRFQANYLVEFMQSFDFVLSLYLMRDMLALSNELSQALCRSRRKAREILNMDYFQVELFFVVLDLQLQELNNCFNEVNMELFLCLACLCPNDTFAAFGKDKLLIALKTQLQNNVMDMRSSTEFVGLKGIGDLDKRMVETRKIRSLVLPVSMATVERRTFSAMKFVKNELRNRMGDEWMNNNLIVYIEKDVFNSIDNEFIAQRFQNMKSRREQL